MSKDTDRSKEQTLRPCPSCGTDNSDGALLAYSWRHWRLRRCTGCGFVYLENPPSYAALDTSQAWEKNRGDRRERMRDEHPLAERLSQARRDARRWLAGLTRPRDKLNRWIATWIPPGRVVDIGCGDGDRISALPPGYWGVGIEISRALAQTAMANLAGRDAEVLNAPAVDGLAAMSAGSASGVVMRSFLEHELRPRALLAEVARVLADDGAAIIKVPNYGSVNRAVMGPRWCGFRFPGHVNYFTPASLKPMVEEAGLAVVRFGLLDRFPLSDNMWILAARRSRTGSSSRWAKASADRRPWRAPDRQPRAPDAIPSSSGAGYLGVDQSETDNSQ